MNEWSLYTGLIYVAKGYRGKTFYYPFDRLEMPMNEGDTLCVIVDYPGIDSRMALDQLAELVGARSLYQITLKQGALIFDGTYYELTNLKNPQKKIDAHNASVRNYHTNKTAVAADRAKATFIGSGGGKDFIGMGLKPGWFVQLASCSIWVEVVSVNTYGLSVMDRTGKHGKLGTVHESYSVTAYRPDAPAFGNYIRADGTANYYDKFYPREVRK